jgi:hypothetical protein
MIPGNRPEDVAYEKQVDLELASITLPMFEAEVRNRWGISIGSEIGQIYFEDWQDSGQTLDNFVNEMGMDAAQIRR